MDKPHTTDQTKRPNRHPLPHPLAEVSIWLDTYDDVFSDFDPRPYNDRTLSDDFIRAVQKEVHGTREGRLEIKLMIPVKLRHTEDERIVAERILEYFRLSSDELSREIRQSKKFGLILTLASIVTIFLAFSTHQLRTPEYVKNLLIAILEPAGWFMIFTGLEKLLLVPGQKHEQQVFLKKMSDCNVQFVEY
jgi:hypothetical protein